MLKIDFFKCLVVKVRIPGGSLIIRTAALSVRPAEVSLGQQFNALRCSANKLCNAAILVHQCGASSVPSALRWETHAYIGQLNILLELHIGTR